MSAVTELHEEERGSTGGDGSSGRERRDSTSHQIFQELLTKAHEPELDAVVVYCDSWLLLLLVVCVCFGCVLGVSLVFVPHCFRALSPPRPFRVD
jgi:hypothetical protein